MEVGEVDQIHVAVLIRIGERIIAPGQASAEAGQLLVGCERTGVCGIDVVEADRLRRPHVGRTEPEKVLGDIVKITSLRNENLDVAIPQMVFDSRIDSIIDLDGCVHMTEETLWQAIENSGLAYQDWVVREEREEKPKIHFYVELKNGVEMYDGQAATAISEQLRQVDPFYCALDDMRDVTTGVPHDMASRGGRPKPS